MIKFGHFSMTSCIGQKIWLSSLQCFDHSKALLHYTKPWNDQNTKAKKWLRDKLIKLENSAVSWCELSFPKKGFNKFDLLK